MRDKEKNIENNQKKFDLQDRLIDYAARFWLPSPCLSRRNEMKTGLVTNTSVTSPAPNYGEAQSTESKADFIYPVR